MNQALGINPLMLMKSAGDRTVELATLRCADSLAAIKKLVFDEKRYLWMCLGAPKFGNDDDYVDSITRELARRISEEVKKCKTNRGTPVIADGW